MNLHRVPKAWLTGTVLDANGRPFANAAVQLTAEGESRSMNMVEMPKNQVTTGQVFWNANSNGVYELIS
jgi:hypothetical protein